MKKNIVFINPNLIKPPVAPLAIEYLATTAENYGYNPIVLDLNTSSLKVNKQINDFFKKETNIYAVCITIRNIDDASYINKTFFLKEYKNITDLVIKSTNAPIIIGGNGFSISTISVLKFLNIDLGIYGEGEISLVNLLDTINDPQNFSKIPGLIYKNICGDFIVNKQSFSDFRQIPIERKYIDNLFYYKNGAQVGIELSRGCASNCSFCVEPMIKGRKVRLRKIINIKNEIKQLLDMGIDHIHLCDSEFNQNPDHLKKFCFMLIKHNFNEKLKWYAYGIPKDINRNMAELLVRSGCNGVNFGVDSCNDIILKNLGRNFTYHDIEKTAKSCRQAKLPFMFDMLFGTPLETKKTIIETIDKIKNLDPDKTGITIAVRLYNNTRMIDDIKKLHKNTYKKYLYGKLDNNSDFLEPVFFSSMDPKLIYYIIQKKCANDTRFLFDFHKDEKLSYNYIDHKYLSKKIKEGNKGAFWSIL